MTEGTRAVQEEPQSARGAPGSRDRGEPHAAGGPTDRTPGKSDAGDSTAIHAQEPIHPDSPTFQAGDQGG